MRGKNLKIIVHLGFFFLCTASKALTATTFILKTEEQKIIESDAICAAKVIEVPAEPPSSFIETRIPMTFARLQAIECFKGNPGSEFFVSWPGGARKRIQEGKEVMTYTTVPGSTNLKRNQTAVLFLVKVQSTDAFYQVHGMVNGVSSLEWNAESKQYIFKNQGSGNSSHNGLPSISYSPRGINEFRAKVKQVLANPPAK